MVILSITPTTETYVTGRMSDGSDRQTVTNTEYIATCSIGDKIIQARFSTSPTETDITNAYNAGNYQDITAQFDIKTYAPTTLDGYKHKQKKIIKQFCNETIIAGFDSTVKYGTTKHYSLADYQRENMKDQEDKLRQGIINKALWHYDGVVQHDAWAKADFLQLCFEKDTFILQSRLYSDSLEKIIDSAETLQEVEAVYWGMALPESEMQYNLGLVSEMQIQA